MFKKKNDYSGDNVGAEYFFNNVVYAVATIYFVF